MPRRLIWLVVAVVAVLAVLLVGDRVGAYFAQRAAADALQSDAPFDQKPKVTVHGFPFLTQVVAGKYDNVEVAGGGLELGDIRGATLDAHLHGMHLALSDLIHRDVQQVRIDSVNGDVTVPYSELARISGISGLTLSGDQGGIKVTAAVSLPLIGTVSATGVATVVVSGANIRLSIQSLSGSAGGVTLPQLELNDLSKLLEVPIDIPDLPYGLKITGVGFGPSGVDVQGGAQNVVVNASGQ
jgi:hypothetical protein